ncbi:MAG: type II toxin-antitoxin system VapC family toxin [Rhizobiaceae bacterium]
MIGLDTNILLRATLNDDPVQSPVAQRLLQGLDQRHPGFVNLLVVMEFFWVLRSRYKLPHLRLARAIRDLLEVEFLEFEALETVGRALVAYESRVADFADLVIALRNRELGLERTFTFDRGAARAIPSMELLA